MLRMASLSELSTADDGVETAAVRPEASAPGADRFEVLLIVSGSTGGENHRDHYHKRTMELIVDGVNRT